MMMIGAP